MTAPLVSVLTPSFNQGRWLKDNLGSVARQTYPSVEHVVADGGSTDGTLEVLRAARPAVRWASEPDRGQSHALNKAFRHSRGEIIGWLNSDDAYFDRHAVEAAVATFERHPDAAVVYGHAALVNAVGLILHMIWVPRFSLRLLRTHNFIIQPAAFVRRSAIERGFVDEAYDYAMDRELWLRLAAGHRFVRADRVLAIDRHHPGRKAYLRDDLRRLDTDRLVATYRVPDGRAAAVRRKALKIAFRGAGLGLTGQASGELAFDRLLDGRARLYARQAVLPRAAMPDGALGSASGPEP